VCLVGFEKYFWIRYVMRLVNCKLFSPSFNLHSARLMAKVIYCFKLYLFRGQSKLTAAENRKLEEFCPFARHIYVKAWISCPIARDAPANDMMLVRQTHQYSTINKTVSDAAKKKFQNHLWYLGAELLPLCLFSDRISVEEKR
jgi:hypothetical protein